MVLNYIWLGFFLIGFLVAILRTIGDPSSPIMNEMVTGLFDMLKTAVMDIGLPLIGMMIFWMGMMKVAEQGGAINVISRLVSPFLSRIMKGVPAGHPAHGSIVMNFSANMLGLDNAATPMGLKAMQELQSINPDKTRASDAQIMFLVLNTSGLTIIPTSIIAYRQIACAADPTDIFLPILIATSVSTLVGFVTVAAIQRINLLQPVIFLHLLVMSLLLGAVVGGLTQLSQSTLGSVSQLASAGLIMLFIGWFLLLGMKKKLNVFDVFIEGAKEGFGVVLQLLPYLVGLLAAISVFRTSGALDYVVDAIAWVASAFTEDTRFAESMPVAMMKPLSGGGARALMLESWGAVDTATGCRPLVDSFTGRLTSVIQGSTETTLFVLAVYFGSVGIKNTRYAVGAGLVADLAGIIAAVVVTYLFWEFVWA
jgi:spore maturation protein SpmA